MFLLTFAILHFGFLYAQQIKHNHSSTLHGFVERRVECQLSDDRLFAQHFQWMGTEKNSFFLVCVKQSAVYSVVSRKLRTMVNQIATLVNCVFPLVWARYSTLNIRNSCYWVTLQSNTSVTCLTRGNWCESKRWLQTQHAGKGYAKFQSATSSKSIAHRRGNTMIGPVQNWKFQCEITWNNNVRWPNAHVESLV